MSEATGRMELPLTEVEIAAEEEQEDEEPSLGHDKFEMHVRHPCEDVK